MEIDQDFFDTLYIKENGSNGWFHIIARALIKPFNPETMVQAMVLLLDSNSEIGAHM